MTQKYHRYQLGFWRLLYTTIRTFLLRLALRSLVPTRDPSTTNPMARPTRFLNCDSALEPTKHHTRPGAVRAAQSTYAANASTCVTGYTVPLGIVIDTYSGRP